MSKIATNDPLDPVANEIVSNKKIKKLLDCAPQFDIRTGLDLTKNYYQPCLEKYFP